MMASETRESATSFCKLLYTIYVVNRTDQQVFKVDACYQQEIT